MGHKVLKFGGSSLKASELQKNVLKIILKEYSENKKIIVVLSAIGNTTNKLLEMATLAQEHNKTYQNLLESTKQDHLNIIKKLVKNTENVTKKIEGLLSDLGSLLDGVFLIGELSNKTQDLILSYGEQLSAIIFTNALNESQDSFEYLDARKIIITDERHTHANILFQETFDRVKQYLKGHSKVQVVTGFIGQTINGITTTLGRDGSDRSASIIGAILDADCVEIWTDVDGIMTTDPTYVEQAFTIGKISYKEAMEISHFGGTVIHPASIAPLAAKNIPLRIKNTKRLDFVGTLIHQFSDDDSLPVRGISSIRGLPLLTLQGPGMLGMAGTSQRLFGALGKKNINVIFITQASSEQSITFSIPPHDLDKAIIEIENEFQWEINNQIIKSPHVENNLSILAIVGQGMKNTPGIAGTLFDSLARGAINIVAIAQGSSELNISFVVKDEDTTHALNIIHDAFFLSRKRILNIFIAGPTGLIGETLINQIEKQSLTLLSSLGLEIRLTGLINTTKMLLLKEGIQLDQWKTQLLENGTESNLRNFIDNMIQEKLPSSVFIDCSASQNISDFYHLILDNCVAIITPNKKANSSSQKQFDELQNVVKKRRANFYFETNVGAGLPIIDTLKGLVKSGDKIESIEGVLSGTMSYVFNNFIEGTLFSNILKDAQRKGLTEPNPSNDLSGDDVVRKIVILARVCGFKVDLNDVEHENICPPSCRGENSLQNFYQNLEKEDSGFENKRKAASEKNEKLCYMAVFKDGNLSVGLKSINSNHPFYSLKDSDNIVSITTQRYSNTPMVIKGPGAGAEVTATTLFADLIKLSGPY